jgi:hypothetical protein
VIYRKAIATELTKKKHFCNICSCNLTVLDYNKGELWCNRCHVSYFPDKEPVKRQSGFETPGDKKMPIVAMVDDNPGLSSTYRKLKLPRSFEEMQKHGVKITSYSTTEEV